MGSCSYLSRLVSYLVCDNDLKRSYEMTWLATLLIGLVIGVLIGILIGWNMHKDFASLLEK